MNILVKILLFAVSISGLILSACILSRFYYIPFLTDTVTVYQGLYPALDIAFSGFMAFIALLFIAELLILALFRPSKSNSVTLKKSKGELVFSKQSVESVIRYSFSSVKGISSSRIKVILDSNPDKTKVYVWLSLNGPAELTAISETVQDNIESAMSTSLGISIKSVNISVMELKDEETPDSNKLESEKASAGRVV